MQKQFTAPTLYFLQEGRENLRECLKVAFQAAKQHNVSKIVIFTAVGEGVRIALDSFCSLPEYSKIKMVAVTFPAGKTFTNKSGENLSVSIAPEDAALFAQHGVPIVRAHLPFDPIAPYYRDRGVLGQDLTLVGEALNMFGVSMALCVQAVSLACDAGAVGLGEHVISLTSDTAILAQASSTRRMLGQLVIREVLCKPAVLSVSRREVADNVPTQLQLDIAPEIKTLPANSEVTDRRAPDKESEGSQ
jgi:hypothetical protein